MIKVTAPDICRVEVDYVLGVFSSWLSMEYEILGKEGGNDIELTCESRTISFKSDLLLLIASGPQEVELQQGIARELELTVGLLDDSFEYTDAASIDLLGLSFFILSGAYELKDVNLDGYGRPRFSEYHLVNKGVLEIPFVDRLFELFCYRLFGRPPENNLLGSKYKFNVTIDVDTAFLFMRRNPLGLVRESLGRGEKTTKTLQLVLRYLECKFGVDGADPYDSFSFIMDRCDHAKLKANFFFIPNGDLYQDVFAYDIRANQIKALLKNISNRGHQLSIHPGYDVKGNDREFSRQISEMDSIVGELGLAKSYKRHVRYHGLRWARGNSLRQMEDAGITLDSTLGFPDRLGYRNGTARTFRLFDEINWCASNVLEQPLILMDTTLFSGKYLGMTSAEEIVALMDAVYQEVKRSQGIFTVLWHNSTFANPAYGALAKEIFQEQLSRYVN